MIRTLHHFAAAILLCPLMACAAVPPDENDLRELYRIRVTNSVYGAVEVSRDEGMSYTLVGRVTKPASASVAGFAASAYARVGHVAATAVHGLRIKVGTHVQANREVPLVISILPREFAHPPEGFGGHIAGSSGICTNIPAGNAIFRNLAPFVGNPVFLQRGIALLPVPSGYSPQPGDVLVVRVLAPSRLPREIVFENRSGGLVEAVFDGGKEAIAIVERPVRGIGRFDATGYTGVGCINTNHSGVITVSTAPVANGERDGGAKETRGGFQIVPSRHARTMGEFPQALVVRPCVPGSQPLEGQPPLFSGNVGLAYDHNSIENSYYVEMRCGDSDWSRLPALVGKMDDALANLAGRGKSVTHLRIRFPRFTQQWLAEQIAASRDAHTARLRASGVPSITGKLVISMDCSSAVGVRYVNLFLDGHVREVRNIPPYLFTVDTTGLATGEHVAEVRASDANGVLVKTVTKRFIVEETRTKDVPR